MAEAAGEEEVLADGAERTLDLALGLGPVGPTGFWHEAVMVGAGQQGGVVDDALVTLAGDRGTHAVVDDLGRDAADRLEGRSVTAQHCLEVLVHDECRPDQPGVSQHHREQPDDAHRAGLVGEFGGELGAELGKVELGLLTRRGLEPALKADERCWPDVAQELGGLAVAARIAELAQLPRQAPRGQVRVGCDALAQVSAVGIEQRQPGQRGPYWGGSRPAWNSV